MGVFGLCGADEAPYGGCGQVGQWVDGAGGDGLVGEDQEVGVVQGGVGQECLNRFEDVLQQGLGGSGHVRDVRAVQVGVSDD